MREAHYMLTIYLEHGETVQVNAASEYVAGYVAGLLVPHPVVAKVTVNLMDGNLVRKFCGAYNKKGRME